ncbi:AAA family ATPase [Aquibacillus albus]|uniref:SpoVK/Ycf46/Vps4 family AAA+-type ATPase n=1 Tax=Aquibacillus albus TaxID=1168171 RepID=A0ABS2N1X5_9BACI|nr:AAA family ATPase [Aquibacillus albus]MBM7572137.1 SpoVK/Ycf46/Vps4 family AAA+-type ATPase [Aquibacillus albus]
MNTENNYKLETTIVEWKTIHSIPPLKEVEVLRNIDAVQKQNLSLSSTSISILYSMLVFYRLKRSFNDDRITDILLEEAKKYDDPPTTLIEIMEMKSFFNFYSTFKDSTLEDWSIRETDFDPAKLKKINELLSDIDQIQQQHKTMKEAENSPLSKLQGKIVEELSILKDNLYDAIEMLENKKTGVPIQQLNNQVKKIVQLLSDFYNQFPEVFRSSMTKDPLVELEGMVGLKEVKQYIHKYYHYLQYQKERRTIGFHMVDEPGLHMIITGNPGTGKTTIARLLAAIYYELGLLEANHVTEVNRSHLVGSYVGQSEENTINFVKQSIGGILFIDEAYSLKREGQSGNDYGQAVIDTLVSSMTSKEFSNRFAVILAGYPEEMRQFLWSNPGLRSRFPEQNHIALPNFKMDELIQIAENTAIENDYFFTEEALNRFESIIDQARVDETFGNARTVRDLVLKAIFQKGATKPLSAQENWLEHMRIDVNDLDLMEDDVTEQNPMDQLERLIGLTNVKQEVRKLSSFVRIQQQRKQAGLPKVPVQLHAVFSGNPGTGKTTVANIYSEILHECGLLKRGHLVIASRSDLVAGFVGQTAIKTKQKVREALGGVLLIDEAYALFRGEKDFGKEAIDTLVDEMTKHNENLVVILAGYKNEMKQFIASNPGLESRFKKYIEFEDYNNEEMLQITKYHVAKYQYEMTDEARHYLSDQFKQFKVDGNARFVVNLIDEAIQFQALRMGETDDNDWTAFKLLTGDDFKNAWITIRGNNH